MFPSLIISNSISFTRHDATKLRLQKLLWQWNNSDRLKQFGVRSSMGLLLTGPGKTTWAHAFASASKMNLIQLNAYVINVSQRLDINVLLQTNLKEC